MALRLQSFPENHWEEGGFPGSLYSKYVLDPEEHVADEMLVNRGQISRPLHLRFAPVRPAPSSRLSRKNSSQLVIQSF